MPHIPLRDRTVACPLSSSQERLWFLEQLNPGVPVYNEIEGVRLKGKLDGEALEKALNISISRHEILRSTIQVIDERPLLVAHKSWPIELKRIDLSPWPMELREAEAQRLLVEEPRRPFDLGTAPGIRGTLVRLAPEEHVFILMMHHIICDWFSKGILWSELSGTYKAIIHGEKPVFPPLTIQHGDYTVWQRQQVAQETHVKDLEYWKETLRDSPRLLDMPGGRARPRSMSYRGARKRFSMGPALTQSARDCSRRENISMFTLFIAALDTLLYRYTGSEDVLLGLPLANRDREELQSVIGFLVQVQVLRTRLSRDMTFRDLAARVGKDVSESYAQRSPPFDHIASAVQSESHESHSPLVQIIVNWRERDQQSSFIAMEGLAVESLVAETGTLKFDLSFILTEGQDDVWLEMEYNTDLFNADRIHRMVEHYRTLLASAAADPGRKLNELTLLPQAEREKIIVEWNQTAMDYPKDRCVSELVQEQAERAPESIAVVSREWALTYRQLNERANQLAHYLKTQGVEANTPVAICVERSAEMVIGILGILKAGGAYLPLDPGYPKDRLAFMIEDSGAEVLLTQQRLCEPVPFAMPGCIRFCLDSDWPGLERFSRDNPRNSATADDLAYIIYTSGSTGRPKGVALKHAGLLNLVFWHRRSYRVTEADKATLVAGVGFDASVWELWPYLTAGASLHIPDEETRLLPDKLRDWLVEREIDLTFVPTPLAEAMLTLKWPAKVGLRAMLTGGDRLTRHLPRLLPFALINHYGPTENTVVTTYAEVGMAKEENQAPPIGRPIDNTRVYVLDPSLEPVPVGVPGELYIAGDGLAPGYLNQPELTAEKFIANPFSDDPASRLYKTGDMARYLADGTIEFIGRNDTQVKIHGFRIELGEIESVLAEHPAIGMAVVMARDDGAGEKRLVAYITSESEYLTATPLREYVNERLPDYMVPATFVLVERIPMTTNGKVDRTALPAPDAENSLPEEESTAPATKIETAVAGILASLLKLDHVDKEANFFALGGHSLLGTQLIARIRDRFGIELPLRKIFESPSVALLSAEIEQILVDEVEAMDEEEVQSFLINAGETSPERAAK